MRIDVNQINPGGLLGRVREIVMRAGNLGPLAEPSRNFALEANRERSIRGVDYKGNPYAPLAKSTIRDRQSKGWPESPPMNRQGNDARVITHCVVTADVVGDEISIKKHWDGIPWLAYHIAGVKGRLPVRDPAGWGHAELGHCMKSMVDYVVGHNTI